MSDRSICSRCIMDSSTPGIGFDANGVCSYCREYDEKAARIVHTGLRAEEELKRLVKQIKGVGKGKPYDAMMGLSGGLDSSYAAYVAHQQGLRLLGVHVDNGWNAQVADDNMRNLAQRLDMPFRVIAPDAEEFKDIQLAFFRSSVPNIEIVTDHAIAAALYRLAAEEGIRYMISGGNVVSEGILPAGYGYHHLDLRHIKAIHRRFGTLKMKAYPTLSIKRTLYCLYVRGIRRVRILNLVPYNRKEAAVLLEDEIGWKPYYAKHYESIFTRFFQGYILPTKNGIDKRRAHLSTLICSGQISREEALQQMEQPPYPDPALLEQDRRTVLTKLGLSEQEFEGLMNQSPKGHFDYPNMNSLFRIASILAKHGIHIGR